MKHLCILGALILSLYDLGRLRKRLSVYWALVSPVAVVSLYFTVFFYVPFYSVLLSGGAFYLPGIFEKYRYAVWPYVQKAVIWAAVIHVMLAVCWMVWLGERRRRSYNVIRGLRGYALAELNTRIFIYFYVSLVGVVTLYLVFKMGGVAQVLSNFPAVAMRLRQGGNTTFMLVVYTIALLPAIYIFYQPRPRAISLILMIMSAIPFIIFTGSRWTLVDAFLNLYLALLVRKMLHRRAVLTIVTTLIVGFLFVSGVRSGSFVGPNTASHFLTYLVRNADQMINSAIVLLKIDSGEIHYQYGYTIIDAMYFLMPSYVFPRKPLSYYPSRLIYGDIARLSGQTFNFGIIGRSYLDFGLGGMIVINLLTFVIFARLWHHLLDASMASRERPPSHRSLIVAYIYAQMLRFYIVGPISHVIPMVVMYAAFILLFTSSLTLFNNFMIQAVRGIPSSKSVEDGVR